MIVLLLLLVCVVVCKSIDTTSSLPVDITSSSGGIIDERELANIDRNEELAPRFNRGDPRVIRRRLTHSPTKKPTRRPTKKPTRRPTRKPTPRKQPSRPTPTSPPVGPGSSIAPPGTILQDAQGKVYVVNSLTQYTTYTSDGTCTTWPYYQAPGNMFVYVFGTYILSKNGNTMIYQSMKDKSYTNFAILKSNPHASKCNAIKSNLNTYSNIIDTFKQGEQFQGIEDDTSFMSVPLLTASSVKLFLFSCNSLTATVLGPFMITNDGRNKLFVSKSNTGAIQLTNSNIDGRVYPLPPYSKVTSVPPSATCATTTTASDLFVNNIINTDLGGKYHNGGIIVNDEMLIYDPISFSSGCGNGVVLKVNLNNGSVTNTTYTVNYNGQSVAARPIYYDGNHLWLNPSCSPGNTLVSTTTDTTKSFSESFASFNGRIGSYAKVDGGEFLYSFNFNENEVYSYNVNTVTVTSLNLRDQIQQQGIEQWQQMTVYNNKLVWVPGIQEKANAFITYDLITKQFGKLFTDDYKSLSEGLACYTCSDAVFYVGSSNKIVYASRPRLNKISRGLSFIIVGSTPTTKGQEKPVTITTSTTMLNRAVGIYYTLQPSGSYNSYQGIFNTDVAIECKQGLYSKVDDYHILLGDDYTYFSKSSKPNTFTIDTDQYDVIPESKLPKRCLSSIKTSLVSFTSLNNGDNFNNFMYAYSSSKSNKLVLYEYNNINVYNAGDNTIGRLIVEPPPKPTSPGMPTQPTANGEYYYPVSINKEYDYWLYQDYNAHNCKLVSSTNSTDVITIPGTYNCFNGFIATGSGGTIYGLDWSTSSIITVNTNTQQVIKEIVIPFSHVKSISYLGNNKLLLYNDLMLIINTGTNTYESYSTFESIIPGECSEDFEMMAVGCTSSGVVGYVNCYSMRADAGIKFTIN